MPRHNALINRILTSSAHVIATVRSKTEYVLAEKNGKQVPEKVGMKSIQRDGLDYEFDLVFDLDRSHNGTATKDRTGLFSTQPPFRLGQGVGEALLSWSQQGGSSRREQLRQSIGNCRTLDDLTALYHSLVPDEQVEFKPDFQNQKQHLLALALAPSSLGNNQLLTPKTYYNGSLAHPA
jgi:hypothetical protein